MRLLLDNVVIIFLVLLVWSPQTRSEQEQHLHGEISNAELDERLKFIENRLAMQRPNARYWQYGWTGFHAASAATQAVLAVDADDSDDELKYIVGAVKSSGALAQMMIKPLPAVQGSIPFQAMPSQTREERVTKLEQGEALLRANAERASTRTGWKRHLVGIGVNLLGGSVIAAFGDSSDAVASTLAGIAVSEINIWTEPSRAITDLQDYRNNTWSQWHNSRVNWQIMPAANRLVVQVRF